MQNNQTFSDEKSTDKKNVPYAKKHNVDMNPAPADLTSGLVEKRIVEPKNINALSFDELEELANNLRIENMQIKEENR